MSSGDNVKFPGKVKEIIIKLWYAKLAQRAVKVKRRIFVLKVTVFRRYVVFFLFCTKLYLMVSYWNYYVNGFFDATLIKFPKLSPQLLAYLALWIMLCEADEFA